ncbi:antirestriction protein [Caballeronia jiangsuensis]|nr:antirestriction protein [Caballeronia jiangsuensis]
MTERIIIAERVPEHKRLGFLPAAFTTRLMLRGEAMAYQEAGRMSDSYKGGMWEFYTLSNGGYYLAPVAPERFAVRVDSNGYEGDVSADAFGVIVTLFVYGALVWINDDNLQAKFSDHYHQLRAFAIQHAEREAILNAID